MKINGYIPYSQIAGKLDIKKGDIILLSSNITKLYMQALKYEKSFDPNILIDSFIDAVGNDGTLLITSYNWDFCSGKPFYYNKTESKTGIIGNIAMQRDDFKRTKHPLYSHFIWGKDKDMLTSIDNIDAFGCDSVFEYLYNNNAKNIGLNCSLNQCFSTIYYFEQKIGVSYRYRKYFRSTYVDENEKSSYKTYSMYVRYVEANSSFNGNELEKHLANNDALKSYNINGLTHNVFLINKAYDIVKEDIINNNSKRFMKYKNQNNKGINTENIKQNIFNTLHTMEKNISTYIYYLKENYLGEINLIENKQMLYGEIVINGYKEDEICIIISTDNIYDIAFSIDVIKYIYTLKERIYSYRIIFMENIENISKIYDINNFKHTIIIQNCIHNIENDTLDINIASSICLCENNKLSNILLLNNNMITLNDDNIELSGGGFYNTLLHIIEYTEKN